MSRSPKRPTASDTWILVTGLVVLPVTFYLDPRVGAAVSASLAVLLGFKQLLDDE